MWGSLRAYIKQFDFEWVKLSFQAVFVFAENDWRIFQFYFLMLIFIPLFASISLFNVGSKQELNIF